MQLTRWNLAVDLTDRSHGAVRFAAALQAETQPNPVDIIATHVVESKSVSESDYPGTGSLVERATAVAKASLDALGAQSLLSALSVVEHDSAEEWLAERGAAPDCDGLIIGRAAQSEGWSLISLGRVARRLTRELPAPTFVVPPDFDGGMRPGPIVAAVGPDSMSSTVVEAADLLSARLHRPCTAVSAIPSAPVRPPTAALPLSDGMAVTVDYEARRQAALLGLRESLGPRLARFQTVCTIGAPAVTVTNVARELDAAFIVCGSGDRSLLGSLFDPDVGDTVAKTASRPVLLIPSEPDVASTEAEPVRAAPQP